MNAALIAIGSELLDAEVEDTNSRWLADRLESLGNRVRCRCVVDDDLTRIARVVAALFETQDLVILTGGLGPTEDDRTRDALAEALGAPLARDRERVASLEARFRSRGFRWTDAQERQADRPRGSAWIENPVGTAPGIEFEREGHRLVSLPGVPGEMKAMFDGSVAPKIQGSSPPARGILKVAGRTESYVDELLRDLYGAPGLEVTILAKPSGIELRLAASERSAGGTASLASAVDAMTGRLGSDLFGKDEETLASVVGAGLLARGETVATAESCTAGLLAGAITEVAGASAWYRGGLVLYADDLKQDLAGVPRTILEEHGAVSAPVAEGLARAARLRCGATHGIGVTGIAGPSGGSAKKPVGLVFVAVSGPRGERASRFLFSGGRSLVRERAVHAALDLLRRQILPS